MARSAFETLEVYRISEQLADSIWKLVRAWDQLSQDTVGKQLVRSADSIGANISEGFGRGTPLDNRRFVRMARGSLYETKHWLRRSYCRELMREADVQQLRPMIDELAPRLNAYLKAIGNKRDNGSRTGFNEASDKQRTTNNRPHTTNHKQQTTNNDPQTTYD